MNSYSYFCYLRQDRHRYCVLKDFHSCASQNFIVVTFLGVELRIKGKAEFSWSESQSYTDFRGERLHKSVIHRGKDTYLKTNIKLVEGKFIIQCFMPLAIGLQAQWDIDILIYYERRKNNVDRWRTYISFRCNATCFCTFCIYWNIWGNYVLWNRQDQCSICMWRHSEKILPCERSTEC